MIAHAQKVYRLLRYNQPDQTLKKMTKSRRISLFSGPSRSEIFYMTKNPKIGEEPKLLNINHLLFYHGL